MNLNPFINLINSILSLYSFILVAWIILGILVRFDIVNQHQVFVRKVNHLGMQLFEPLFAQIRRFIPVMGGLDFSPIIVFLLINFIKEFLFTYLYKI